MHRLWSLRSDQDETCATNGAELLIVAKLAGLRYRSSLVAESGFLEEIGYLSAASVAIDVHNRRLGRSQRWWEQTSAALRQHL